MARSTGLVLTAGAIVIGNEFAQGAKPADLFRPGIATLGTALIFAGLEKLDEQAAVGLSVIVIISVLFAGLNPKYRSPFQEISFLIGNKKG